MIPHACLTLAEHSLPRLREKLARYADRVEYIEVRLDFLRIPEPPKPPLSGTRFIATCRPVREGGRFAGPEEDRLDLLRRAAARGFHWIDLEYDVPARIESFRPARVLRSRHDFEKVTNCPAECWEALRHLPGDGFKLAVSPRNLDELATLFALLRETPPEPPRVLLGMGSLGQLTRYLSPWLGNAWTYVIEPNGRRVAPGQFDLNEAEALYRRVESTVPELYLFLGRRPRCQAGSLRILNRWMLEQVDTPSRCLWWPVEELSDLVSWVDVLNLPIRGLNVDLMEWFLDGSQGGEEHVAFVADDVGSSLRVVGVWEEAFWSPLEARGLSRPRSVVVLGTGRAARRAVRALRGRADEIRVAGSDPERTRQISARWGCAWAELGRLSSAELVVDCRGDENTENGGETLPVSGFEPTVVYDLSGSALGRWRQKSSDRSGSVVPGREMVEEWWRRTLSSWFQVPIPRNEFSNFVKRIENE